MYSDKDDKEIKKPIDKDKKDKPLEKEEDFYSDFYDYVNENGYDDDIEEEPDLESERKKKTRMRVAITTILLVILAVLVILLTKSCNHKQKVVDKKPEVTVNTTQITVKEGEEFQIDYKLENFKDDATITFTSADSSIATVTEEGLVTGVKAGKTEIIISYFIEEKPYEKRCEVNVEEKEKDPDPPKPDPPKPQPEKDTKAPTLNASITNGSDNTWTNHDITIKVSASDNSGKVTVQYALDCTNNCKYTNVSNGQITVSKEGTTIVNIIAKDPSNNKATKNFTIKIDKTKPTCSLSVNAGGKITATKNDANIISYFGFSSNYSGSNESEKVVTAGSYTYYVKDEAGNTNSCSLNVKSKIQYRSRTCAQEHMKFSSWTKRKTVYTTSCSLYTKSESERAGNTWYHQRETAPPYQCNYSTKQCYMCTTYGRSFNGCNWGDEQWSAYQDTKPEESSKVQVEQVTVYYS